MFERRSLKLPITLGVTMIVMIVTLIVGWVLLTVFAALSQQNSTVYWTLLTVGTILLAIVVATLSHRKLQEREGRWLKLVSGLVILALGLVMIFKPAWLQLSN